MKAYKLLLIGLVSLLCVPLLSACGGDDDNNDNDSHDGRYHHYRVEVDYEGDNISYLMQVLINCIDENVPFTSRADYIDLTIDGQESMRVVTDSTFHLKQALTGYPNSSHNFIFGNHHAYETVEKGTLLTVRLMNSVLAGKEPTGAAPLTTTVRIYKDNKLVKESEGTATGFDVYTFGAESF